MVVSPEEKKLVAELMKEHNELLRSLNRGSKKVIEAKA